MIRLALAIAAWLSLAPATAALAANPKSFASPDLAAAALAAAWHSGRTADLLAIFGSAGEKLVASPDTAAEQRARAALAAAYDAAHRIDPDGPGRAILIIGNDDWPYPIPIVEVDVAWRDAGWRFDATAGLDQIIDRRVGRNEMDAVEVCRAYVEAQRDYAAARPGGGALHQYAQRLASTEGRHDGLYWKPAAGVPESPLGALAAAAEASGFGLGTAAGRTPFHGYYYRVLTQQGKAAPGGARSYIVNGHMTAGFALVAFPATWGNTGVMTFMVNQTGIVFQKNLGPDTPVLASGITTYDPDPTWTLVQP